MVRCALSTGTLLALACWGVAFASAADPETKVEPEETKEAPSEPVDGESGEKEDDKDETKQLLAQLQIMMTGDAIDGRSFVIRDATKPGTKGNMILRLGNVALPEQGSLNDADHQERLKTGMDALAKAVNKKTIWMKLAADEHQPQQADGSDPIVLGDAWTMDGRHISGLLRTDGHLVAIEEYQEELAKDILTAASEQSKKDSYKELEIALKESAKEKQAQKDAQRDAAMKLREEEEASRTEPFGISGWIGIAVVLVVVIGAATNFGRPSNKKLNLNRKRGPLERFWMKLKGA